MRNKKTVLISLLVIVPLAIIILAALTPLLMSSFFQPRSGPPPQNDEAENTHTATTTTNNLSNDALVTTIMPTTIDILSTTFAFPFVQRWIAQYENQQLGSLGDVNVDYLSDREIVVAEEEDGSDGNNLAIVGVPNENRNALNVPVSAQAVAIVYNIPGFPDIPSGLKLNSTILSLMLNGSITHWNDAGLKELNPSLNLPEDRIVIVHSGGSDNNNDDGSSSVSQMLLNRYLGLPSLSWPKNDSIIASGPAELAELVRKTPYSIGYVDFSFAIQTRMTYAAIGNANGDYILPSMQSIDRAIDVALQFQNSSSDPTRPQQQQQQQQQPQPPPPPIVNTSRIVGDAYPMLGLYYASFFANEHDKEEEEIRRIAAMLDFVEWIISESGGQQTLLEVQYPPIYSRNEQLADYAEIVFDTVQHSIAN